MMYASKFSLEAKILDTKISIFMLSQPRLQLLNSTT